ncbi:centromere/kinetochore protein zw10 homolog isoform X2 [Mytilus edulis]|uniref:centromere/kinetochore protein zw10 homolog isoform X2 n=1 Tax=Mytilus edulis TaxID=6550 RepID=UPI0039F14854
MASFVTEVLSSAGKLETQEIQGKIEVLNKKLTDMKMQVHDSIHQQYVNFLPRLKTAQTLSDNVGSLSKEMTEVADKIENEIKSQLNMSTGVFQTLNTQYQEASEVLVVLDKIVQIQNTLESATLANKSKDFAKAAEALLEIQVSLSKPITEDDSEIKILSALHEESCVQKEKFLFDLGDQWKELIVWDVSKVSEKTGEIICKLKLEKDADSLESLRGIVMAMHKFGILESKMKHFGNQLLTYILNPLITDSDCQVAISPNSSTIQVRYISGNKQSTYQNPKEVFSNFGNILHLLNDCFLKLFNVDTGGKQRYPNLMELLGGAISSKVLELIKECLKAAIPINNSELESFKDIVLMTDTVHYKWVEIHFIPPSNNVLVDFIQNINVLFANKKCQAILERARKLMTTEIHNTVKVSSDRPLGELPPLGPDSGGGKKKRKLDLANEVHLSSNTFRLPECHISVCVQELMNVAYDTLTEATESSEQCAIQLFFAVRNMFELFCSVIPTFHRDSLLKFPQLSAIFHNNCMFIAHHLMTLGHQFSKNLPTNISSTFVDLVPKVRKLGAEHFLQQLAQQKKIMTVYLEGAKGFVNVSDEQVYFDAEKSIKQTLFQFQHLQKVWQEVLPGSIYRKAVGTLMNGVISDIVASIVILEDISSDDAKHLGSLLTLIQDKAGGLFEASDEEGINVKVELQRNVPKWLRFGELISILNASLLEIADRWADGKGPLANEFSATEVKQMIRALFQNTERRANILTKIK